jgi:hypothetical protein
LYRFVVEFPNAPDSPDMLPHRDTAVRGEHASGTSWILALALVALTVIAAIMVVVVTA